MKISRNVENIKEIYYYLGVSRYSSLLNGRLKIKAT